MPQAYEEWSAIDAAITSIQRLSVGNRFCFQIEKARKSIQDLLYNEIKYVDLKPLTIIERTKMIRDGLHWSLRDSLAAAKSVDSFDNEVLLIEIDKLIDKS